MGAFFGFIFGLWFVVGMVVAIYFWFTKTDRSQSPIERRLTAMVWGLGWPYHAVKIFTNRSQADQARVDHQAASQRILGGGGTVSKPTPPAGANSTVKQPSSQSKIQNPFDA